MEENEIIRLIQKSPSIDPNRKKIYIAALSMMNEEQQEKLKDILLKEKAQSNAIKTERVERKKEACQKSEEEMKVKMNEQYAAGKSASENADREKAEQLINNI